MKTATLHISEKYNWWFYIVICLGSSALLSNVFIGFMMRKQELRKRISNLFLLLLLCTHTIITAEGLVFFWTFILDVDSATLQRTQQSLVASSISMVLLSVFLITADRYIAITRCFFYQRLTVKFPLVSGILVSGFGIVAFFIQYYKSSDASNSSPIVICLSFLTLAVLCASNFRIYHIIKQQFTQIRQNTVSTDEDATQKLKQDLLKREIKSTKVCLRIVAAYFGTVFPITLFMLCEELFDFYPSEVETVVMLIGICKCIVDPLICLQSNQEMKREIRDVFTITISKVFRTMNISKYIDVFNRSR